jgi:SAM-dependent methyltransferase
MKPLSPLARLKSLLRSMYRRLQVLTYALRPAIPVDRTRYAYQQPFIHQRFPPGARVLDVGSGGDPFPYATVLVDRYLEPTHHRTDAFHRSGLPVVIADIHALPFAAQTFDYVMCSHVLEHVDDPVRACAELQRSARAGFIETPTLLKDALFAWAKGMHRWHLLAIGQRLVFFEYDDRQLLGIRSPAWHNMIFGPAYHPLQAAFRDNQDIFNVMREWAGGFEVCVMRLDGTVQMFTPVEEAESAVHA